VSVNILTIFSELLANLISYRTDAVTKISKHVEAPDVMRPEPPAAQTEVHVTPPKTVCLENAVP
jgi:predicted transcriptional regulator